MNILKKIKNSFKKDLPFVAYRKPNEDLVAGFFQQSNELFFTENYTESGFVFAPFNVENPTILIPENQSDFLQEKITIDENFELKSNFEPDISSEENHISLVEKGVEAIKDNQFKKVVLSRKETIQLTDFDLIKTFKKLLKTYPKAMVYVWFHPKIGLWLGATPETLLEIKEGEFETMSLAGTQLYSGTTEVKWQQKEIEEQQFVTDFIVGNLKTLVNNLQVSKVKTIKAGNLLHLQTKITGKLKTKNLKLLTVLHPTPAVCGLPKEAAKKFILENENYNRSFYTGFLGELNFKNTNITSNKTEKSNLFVNLRCMEVEENLANIYVGGGITKDSNPKKEWQETVAKAKVMKSIL